MAQAGRAAMEGAHEPRAHLKPSAVLSSAREVHTSEKAKDRKKQTVGK